MAHIAEGADVRAVLRRLRPGDIVTHAFTASGPGILGDDGRVLPEAHDAAGARRPVRHRPRLRQLLVGDRRAGAGRGPRARRDQHRPPPLLDRAPGGRPADHDVALPRARACRSTRSSPRRPRVRRRSSAGPSSGTLRVGGPADVTVLADRRRRRSTCPMPRACAGRSSPMLRPVWTIAGGVAPPAADVEVPLRPYPRRRPRGRLLASRSERSPGGDRPRSGQVPQAEPVELGAVARPGRRAGRRRARPTRSVDDVRVAAHAAGLVERIGVGRVQLAGERPCLAAIAG